MSGNLKRLHGATISSSELDGLEILNSFIYPTDSKGKIPEGAEQEHIRWLLTSEDMENLHKQLSQKLGKSN